MFSASLVSLSLFNDSSDNNAFSRDSIFVDEEPYLYTLHSSLIEGFSSLEI